MNKHLPDFQNLISFTIRHQITPVSLIAEALKKRCCRLLSISLSSRTMWAGKIVPAGSHPALKQYACLISQYLDGAHNDLSSIGISTDEFSEFRRRVTKAAQTIPYGKTVSYAGLACKAGYPRAVRAVASVMRNNPFPLVVPCHRVIRSDGSIGGYAGKTSGKPVALKRRLLALEKNTAE